MALIVRVYVNDRCIIETHCVRIKGQPGEMCTYQLDDGRVIKHHYDRGAAVLGSRLLRLFRGDLFVRPKASHTKHT